MRILSAPASLAVVLVLGVQGCGTDTDTGTGTAETTKEPEATAEDLRAGIEQRLAEPFSFSYSTFSSDGVDDPLGASGGGEVDVAAGLGSLETFYSFSGLGRSESVEQGQRVVAGTTYLRQGVEEACWVELDELGTPEQVEQVRETEIVRLLRSVEPHPDGLGGPGELDVVVPLSAVVALLTGAVPGSGAVGGDVEDVDVPASLRPGAAGVRASSSTSPRRPRWRRRRAWTSGTRSVGCTTRSPSSCWTPSAWGWTSSASRWTSSVRPRRSSSSRSAPVPSRVWASVSDGTGPGSAARPRSTSCTAGSA